MGTKVSVSFLKGTIILTLFSFLGKALGAIFKITLTNLVGAEGVGIYGLVFPIFVFFEILASDGYSLGLTVNIAKFKNQEKAKGYLNFAFKLIVFTAFISSILILILSGVFSRLQGGVPKTVYFIVALSVFSVSILNFFKAVVRGNEQFKLFSITEIIEDISKIVASEIILSK